MKVTIVFGVFWDLLIAINRYILQHMCHVVHFNYTVDLQMNRKKRNKKSPYFSESLNKFSIVVPFLTA